MFGTIKKVLSLLSRSERRHAIMLLGMVFIMAMLDVIGIASVMPFLAVLANPDVVHANSVLNRTFIAFGFNDINDFLFLLGFVVFLALLVSVSFKALTTWFTINFAQMRSYSISRRLLAGYLSQPYEWFLRRHGADLGKNALSEVHLVVQTALVPLMHVIAQGTVVLAILMFLIIIDPTLALVVGAGMGGAYSLTYLTMRQFLASIGEIRVSANQERFRVVNEAFGGIKEIKLKGKERTFLSRFEEPATQFARTQAIAQIAGLLPRYFLEAIAFGGMILLALFLMRRSIGLEGALPVLGLYALAGYRLLPALQLAYHNAATLRFSTEALEQLHQDLHGKSGFLSLDSKPPQDFQCCGDIYLDNVCYTYPGSTEPAVKELNLRFPSRSTIGLVGKTGSGKTTAADISLGLLVPQVGSVRVGNVRIEQENRRSWQRCLGYVPQQIFLSDETIASNIAFGVPDELIDFDLVAEVARVANLHEFVVNELEGGYHTMIGEGGVRLSGGQRQRIGIARALYYRPEILVMDEATSALDYRTEQIVMEAVQNLAGEITIILIAHRLTTVRDCDQIYVFERGRVIGEGTYAKLSKTNLQFRSLVGSD